jgi:hypothetical protein
MADITNNQVAPASTAKRIIATFFPSPSHNITATAVAVASIAAAIVLGRVAPYAPVITSVLAAGIMAGGAALVGGITADARRETRGDLGGDR